MPVTDPCFGEHPAPVSALQQLLMTWGRLNHISSWSVRLEFSKSVLQINLEFPPGLMRKMLSSCSSSSNFANKCQARVGDGMLRKFLVHVFTVEDLAVQLMLLQMGSAHNYQVRARFCIEVKISIYLV